MSIFANSRKQYNDLLSQRAKHLAAAEAAKNAGNNGEYDSFMQKAKDMNPQLDALKAEIEEADRYADAHAPKFGQDRKDIEEMGRALKAKERVKVDLTDAIAGLRRDSVLYSGTVTQPTGSGTEIRDGFNAQVSSLIDQVQTISLTGLSGWEEPYVLSDMDAVGGDVATVAGTARAATDPTFRKAGFSAYEATVTTYVDRNIADLSSAQYAAKVQTQALRALRRYVNGLILNGDGLGSPKMWGILNAKNTQGEEIFGTIDNVTGITFDTLDELVFGYGGDAEVGGNARLLVTKQNLKLLGALRGTNEKKRLFNIVQDPGNPNTGTISDGGLIVPYTITPGIGNKLAYGDPYNYLLGLFGDFTVRVDESYKAAERLLTILGDVKVGGNLVVDKGFVVATLTEG